MFIIKRKTLHYVKRKKNIPDSCIIEIIEVPLHRFSREREEIGV